MFSNSCQNLAVEFGKIDLKGAELSSRGIRVRSWVVKAGRIIINLTVRNVDITDRLSIGEFSKSANNKSVSRVEIFPLHLQITDELCPFLLNSHLVVQVSVVWINELKVVFTLKAFQGIQNRRSVGLGLQIISPKLVAFHSLPSHCPSTALHTDIVEISEQLNPGKTIDVVNLLSNQNHIFDGAKQSFCWDCVAVLEQDE